MKTKTSAQHRTNQHSPSRSRLGRLFARNKLIDRSGESLELPQDANAFSAVESAIDKEHVTLDQLSDLLAACYSEGLGCAHSPAVIEYLTSVEPEDLYEVFMREADGLSRYEEQALLETIERIMSRGIRILNQRVEPPMGDKLRLLLASMRAFEHIRYGSHNGLNAMQAMRYYHDAKSGDGPYWDEDLDETSPLLKYVQEWRERREEIVQCQCFMCEYKQRWSQYNNEGTYDGRDGVGSLLKQWVDESVTPSETTSFGRPISKYRNYDNKQEHELDLLWFAKSNLEGLEAIDPDFGNTLALCIARDGHKRMVQRLHDILGTAGLGQRRLLTEALNTIQFGTDYGDVILGIAESGQEQEVGEFLRAFLELRELFTGYASLFSGVDPELARQVAAAAIDRSTELAYVAREIAKNGSATASYMGRSVTARSLSELTEHITTLSECVARIANLMQNGKATLANTGRDGSYEQFRFADGEHDMLLFVRAFGDHRFDKLVEYGTESGVEASISTKINVRGGHIGALKHDTHDELSIRLDREGRVPGEMFKGTSERDPTQDNGVMSLDIGSVLGQEGTFGSTIALLISLGNDLRSSELRREPSFNHVTNFDQAAYGTASGFAEIAQSILRQAHASRARSRQKGSGYTVRKAAA